MTLELANIQMYVFHQNIMQPHFDCPLLYSDIDSLFYIEIEEPENQIFVISLIFKITLRSIEFSITTTDLAFSFMRMSSQDKSSKSLFR